MQEAREGRLARLMTDSERRRAARGAGDHGRGPALQRGAYRTVNNPLSPEILQAEYSHRFRFTVGSREKKLGPAVRKVSFEEVTSDRSDNGRQRGLPRTA